MAIAVLLSGRPSSAEVRDNEGWFWITATGPIVDRWRLFLEVQPRIGTNAATGDVDMRALIARGAIGWSVTPKWSLWGGYGYTPTFNPDRDEHRIFQQSLYDTMLGPFKVTNRTRLEERLFQEAPDVSFRIRNLLRFAYPVPRWPAWSLVAADEWFLNLNSVRTAPVSGFDQNRFYAGISRQVTPYLRVEVDYLNQVVNGRRGSDDPLRHSGVLQFMFNW